MLHTLRGQLSHAKWSLLLLLVPREAGDRTISPAFFVLSPGLIGVCRLLGKRDRQVLCGSWRPVRPGGPRA
jgi:hypothetical protein